MNGVTKNFFYLSAYKILEMLLPIITSPLLSRKLGADALGIYTYSFSIVSMFLIVAELGVYRYGMREIAKVRNNKKLLDQTYSNIYFTHVFCGVCVLFVYLFFVTVVVKQNIILFFIQSGAIISNILDNAFLYVGVEDIRTLTLRDATIKLAAFFLIITVIKKPSDLLLYTVIMVISSIIGKVVALLYAKKYVKFKKPILSACKQHLKPMVILMIPALASVIYQSMDRIMIGRFYNNADVGYYECASKTLIPKNIISALGTVLCPGISKLYAEGKYKEVYNKFSGSMKVSLIMSYVFMFGIIAVAKEFAPFFWGKEFAVCSNLMIGLSITLPLWCVGEVIRNQYLLPSGRDNQYMIAFVIGVLINVIINFILIPIHGAMGAIVATTLAELGMSFVQIFFIRKEINNLKLIFETLPYLFMGLGMVVVVRQVSGFLNDNLVLKLLVEILVGVITFSGLCIIYERNSKQKYLILMLKKIIKR